MFKQVVVFAIGFLFASGAFANALQSRMDAFVVDKDNQGNELLRPAKEVEPGQMIEWRIVFNNVTAEPQHNLVVTGPVPSNTLYVGKTDKADVPANLIVSIDGGKNYQPEPVVRKVRQANGSMRDEVVPPSEYTHVRWESQSPVLGFGSQEFRYRVRVK